MLARQGRPDTSFGQSWLPNGADNFPAKRPSFWTVTEKDSAPAPEVWSARRSIYLFAHESSEGVTASMVAEQFDLHANVARHHLDKLASGGYLEVSTERPAGGAGRPSKRYRVIDQSQ